MHTDTQAVAIITSTSSTTLRATRALILCIASGLLALACSQQQSPPGRVLLIGIDGAAPRLALPWAKKGLLKNLAAIAHEGVAGPLRAHHPLLSPRIWTSIATGKSAEQHGIGGWVFKDESGRPRMYRSSDRKGHALWNIASAAGLTVAVVNWLNTYPPEIVNGVMLSDFAVPGERQAKEGLGALFARGLSGEELANKNENTVTTHPAEWESRLEEIGDGVGVPAHFTNDPKSEVHLRPGAVKVLNNSYRSDRLVTTAALEIEAQLHPDLMMVYLSSIDRTSHFLWGGFEPPAQYAESVRFSPDEKLAAAQAIREVYLFTDGLIGELASRYSQQDLVIVVSDHGFEARVKGDHGLTGTHDSKRAEHGVLFARGAHIAAGTTGEGVSVNDITPTILSWLGLAVGRDMQGTPASFLDLPPPAMVDTHDSGEILRVSGSGNDVEASYIDELRALGYVEDEALPEKSEAPPMDGATN